MQRFLLLIAIVMLTACTQQALQPAQGTAEAVINQIGPTARAAVNELAPTVRALIPTSPPPDPQYPNTLDKPLIACFAPRCGAEDAIILPAGTRYKNTEQDDGAWRFIQVQGGGQVWILRAPLARGSGQSQARPQCLEGAACADHNLLTAFRLRQHGT